MRVYELSDGSSETLTGLRDRIDARPPGQASNQRKSFLETYIFYVR